MEFAKGTSVILNQRIHDHPAGSPGRVIRIDERWFGATRYSVLLDNGDVIEELTEEELFAPDI